MADANATEHGEGPDSGALPDANGDDTQTLDSVLSGLQEKHKEVKQDRHLDCDIPGYDGELFCRFVPYEVADSEKKAKALARDMKANRPVALPMSCDTLIDACDEFYVRTKDGRELAIDKDVPVKFDKRLAQLLKFDGPHISDARQVVIELFPTQQAILAMSAEVSEWLATAKSDSEEEFAGESRGTTR